MATDRPGAGLITPLLLSRAFLVNASGKPWLEARYFEAGRIDLVGTDHPLATSSNDMGQRVM